MLWILPGGQNLIIWCVPQRFSYHCSFLIKMSYSIKWDVLQMYIISPEMYKFRRWYWTSLTGISFYEWMFIGVNYIILYICINLFQDQLFHNFARDQCQDEKPVITLVILFTFFWNREEKKKRKKSALFPFKPSLRTCYKWSVVILGQLFKLLLSSYQRAC